MRLSLTRSESVELTTIITPRQWSLLCLLFAVRLGDYIVNSSDFYSDRLIGKLTVFFATSLLLLRLKLYVVYLRTTQCLRDV
jgi:hypothetical protein